jgi:hypothetical protein
MWHIWLNETRWKEPAKFVGGVNFSTWVDDDVFRPFLAGEWNSIQQESEDINYCVVKAGMRLTEALWRCNVAAQLQYKLHTQYEHDKSGDDMQKIRGLPAVDKRLTRY